MLQPGQRLRLPLAEFTVHPRAQGLHSLADSYLLMPGLSLPVNFSAPWLADYLGKRVRFCDAQERDLVLAVLGSTLTMLSEPTGIGQGASGAHADAFGDVAQALARRITSTLQRDFDRTELDEAFPGQPHAAYFELCVEQEDDTDKLVANAVALKSAGYPVAHEWLAERTGYELEEVDSSLAPNGGEGRGEGAGGEEGAPPILNRLPQPASTRVAAALQSQLAPVRARLAAIGKVSDPRRSRRSSTSSPPTSPPSPRRSRRTTPSPAS